LESVNLLGSLTGEQQEAYVLLQDVLAGATNGAVSGFRASIAREGMGEMLRWESEPFLRYRVEALSALGDVGMVEVVASNVTTTAPLNEVALEVDEPQRFFWVEVE